jgi:HK97 family phage major capsid protein
MTRKDLEGLVKEIVKTALGDTFAEQVKEAREKAQAEVGNVYAAMAKAAMGGGQQTPPPAKGLMFGRMVRALAAGKGDSERALKFVKEVWKDATVAAAFEKALSAGSAPGGGFLVPVEYSTEIIEFLRARAIVRSFNPTTMPMPTGTVTIPKLATGVNAAYVGENANITKVEQAFGSLTLTYKKLAALTPVSNDLIRFASPSADTVVRNDLVAALAVREDLAFIRGDGTANTPKGIRNWIPAANVIAANGTVNLANITQDLGKLLLALKNANIQFITPGWMMAPRTEVYLMTLLTSNGVYAFREEMLTGKLWGMPYKTTTQIPTNLGSGSDSEVYLTDFSDVVIGESEQIIIDVSMEAAYYDGSTVQASFSQDQTVIRALSMHDIGMRHDLSAAVLTTVQWL